MVKFYIERRKRRNVSVFGGYAGLSLRRFIGRSNKVDKFGEGPWP